MLRHIDYSCGVCVLSFVFVIEHKKGLKYTITMVSGSTAKQQVRCFCDDPLQAEGGICPCSRHDLKPMAIHELSPTLLCVVVVVGKRSWGEE